MKVYLNSYNDNTLAVLAICRDKATGQVITEVTVNPEGEVDLFIPEGGEIVLRSVPVVKAEESDTEPEAPHTNGNPVHTGAGLVFDFSGELPPDFDELDDAAARLALTTNPNFTTITVFGVTSVPAEVLAYVDATAPNELGEITLTRKIPVAPVNNGNPQMVEDALHFDFSGGGAINTEDLDIAEENLAAPAPPEGTQVQRQFNRIVVIDRPEDEGAHPELSYTVDGNSTIITVTPVAGGAS